ncbi:HAD family hydrolase, partial [Vagococcus sp.]
MITHIFSDLDGTLLDEEGKVTPKTVKTIKKSGIPFSLVSARTPNDMEKIANSTKTNLE